MRNLWILLQRHAFLLAFIALMGLVLFGVGPKRWQRTFQLVCRHGWPFRFGGGTTAAMV